MKTLRTLIRLDAILLAFFGLLMATSTYSVTVPEGVYRFDQEQTPLIFLGTSVVVLAVVLFVVSDFALIGHRRKLGNLLAAGNLVIAVTVMAGQPSYWGRFIGWIPALVLLIMAIALALASRRPPGPGDTSAELAALQIPDDIRQALLRQIGEAAAQEERNRLARDLHDSIKQQIFTINVSAAAAQELWERDPEKARAALADVRRSAREGMVEMQALLHQLTPRALATVGLIEAVREQCEALGYRTGVEVKLELGEAIPDDRLPPGAQETLFRIAQEALSNVARHARARNVRVWLGRESEAVKLLVEDDGQGFQPEQASSGMGLRNLRERTASLHGTLEIASAPGAGTRVMESVPLTPPPPPDIPTIRIATDRAVADIVVSIGLVGVYLWTTPPDEPYYFGAVFTLVLLGSAAWNWYSAGKATLFRHATPEEISRLRHARERNRVFQLFLAACWSFYIWSLTPDGWNAGRIAWGATTFLCTTLAGLDLTLYHRRSRPRNAWPKWSWRSLRRYGNSFAAMGILLLVFVLQPQRLTGLESRQLLWAFPVGAVLVYLFSRQARMEGAAR